MLGIENCKNFEFVLKAFIIKQNSSPQEKLRCLLYFSFEMEPQKENARNENFLLEQVESFSSQKVKSSPPSAFLSQNYVNFLDKKKIQSKLKV